MDENKIFKIFTKKIYWIICLTIPLVFPIILISLIVFTGARDISISLIVFSYFIWVVGICLFTLIISLIVGTIKDLIVLRGKERWFLIILLIIFTLKAMAEILRTQ